MSLRLRLTLLITGIFVLVFIAGAALAISAARTAVIKEVASTARLTLAILDAASASAAAGTNPLPALIARLAEFQPTRHMTIELHGIGDAGLPRAADTTRPPRSIDAPRWFTTLVEPDPLSIRDALNIPGQPDAELVIRADPGDEIEEAWQEVKTLLALIAAFALLANLLVFVGIGRGLRPLAGIERGLSAIEQGDYRSRLARPDLPELGRVADKVNRIAATLEASREQTRFLAQRTLAIQEEERRHLAHELHDEMGQSISAIMAVAVSIEQRAALIDPTIAAGARTITATSGNVYATVRGMMRRLRPVVLDELGLVPALEQLIDDWNTHHTDTFCAFTPDGDFSALGEATDITIYRIIQEALTNVARHAHAQRVEIELRRTGPGSELQLRIADDGAGFDSMTVPRGLGLLGMQERVAALAGEFVLASDAPGGTRIDIHIPAAVS